MTRLPSARRIAQAIAPWLDEPRTVEELAALTGYPRGGYPPSDVSRGLAHLIRSGRLRVEHVAVWSLSEPVAGQVELPVLRRVG